MYKGPKEFHSFEVGGKGRFRMAVSFFSKGQEVEILDGDDGIALPSLMSQMGVLDHLPKENFSTALGFTWCDVLKSVSCDSQFKKAKCTESRVGTMITSQVLTKLDRCDLVLRVLEAGGHEEILGFGVVSDRPRGFGHLPIGDEDLPNSIGACCTRDRGGIIHLGNKDKSTPGIKKLGNSNAGCAGRIGEMT